MKALYCIVLLERKSKENHLLMEFIAAPTTKQKHKGNLSGPLYVFIIPFYSIPARGIYLQ